MAGNSSRTSEEIVADCNKLAREFYLRHGNEVPEDYLFYRAEHPQEIGMWNLACCAYEHIEGTDVEAILEELNDS